jgi:UDP-glucose:(heptosyl)LPS alpha-1,3-glucosyltransferase
VDAAAAAEKGPAVKIALVIERMFVQRGGRERSVGELAAELVRRGHDVTILCQEGAAGDDRVKVAPLGRPAFPWGPGVGRFAGAVRQAVQRAKFDIVHATIPVPGVDVCQPRGGTVMGNLQARRRRAPVAGRLDWLVAQMSLSRRGTRRKLEQAAAADRRTTCLAISRMVAEEFRHHYGRNAVPVIYGGVQVPRAAPEQRLGWRRQWRTAWGVDDGDTVFLAVAENFRLKGVGETIDAFGRFVHCGHANARLVVVGGAPAGAYRRRAERAGVGDRVQFEGHVQDVFPLYSAADAVAHLSWYDACSRVVLEAIRWGVPSLTTRYNGAAEIVGAAGIVVDSPGAVAAAAEAMAQLADPQQRRAMTAACRGLADFVGLARQVDQLLDLYADILARRELPQ